MLSIRTRRICPVVAVAGMLALGGCSSSNSHPQSVGSAGKALARAVATNPKLTEWDLPGSDRPPVPGEVCTMTYAPTGYGGTDMSGTLTQRGDLIMQAVGPDGPDRNVFRGVYTGDGNGMVFNLAPDKITALSAQLVLANGTTHDCSLEPFHRR